ncbi:MAG: TraM recognition domain-containing protein, partial [Clostridia bacterium]|nr:TraM recognition domain-containing protein [Clostridia bacterium]
RSRKISFSVILQNLDQLEAVYEKSYETIIGNCDTHVFLGSNSQKTVEYFSKALGEKTIERESVSVNKDKHNWRQGVNVSDQVMARALMTPDELRRMDNDLCIIYEKGIKPIKAEKFYYFQTGMAKKLDAYTMSHNDVEQVDRGEWRKYNPYNPYVPEDEKNKQVDNLKVESLDDLFDEPEEKSQPKQENKLDEIKVENIDQVEAPILPQGDKTLEDELDMDLQKELEAKFDELFGPLDDNND